MRISRPSWYSIFYHIFLIGLILGGVVLGASIDKIPFWLGLTLIYSLFVLADMFLFGHELLIEKEYKERHQAESDDVPSTMLSSRLWRRIVPNVSIFGSAWATWVVYYYTQIPFWLALILFFFLVGLVNVFLGEPRQAESDDVTSTMLFSRLWPSIVFNGFILGCAFLVVHYTQIPFWLFFILLSCLLVLVNMFLGAYKLIEKEYYKELRQAESDDVPSTMKE